MPNTLPVGTILRNQYLIQELLGDGAFSAVYLANAVSLVEDSRGKRYISTRFALKEVVIPSRHLRHHINLETVPLRGIDHEALPHIYDVFNSNKYNRLYMLMDYIEGPNLDKLRTQQPGRRLPLSQVMTIMVPILGAVSHLHSQQPPIIHQNIEPDSIIISQAGNKPVLVDFRVGKQYNLSSQDAPIRGSTINYEAPEQYDGAISTRTDIYGLGATLYTLLTGIVPADALQRKRLIESENVDPLKPVDQLVPAIPAHVAEAIQQAMSLNGSDRFSTAEQFTQALKSELVRQPPEQVTVGSARQDQQAPPPRVEPAVVEEQKQEVFTMSTNSQLPHTLEKVSPASRLEGSSTKNSRIAFTVILILLLLAISTVGALFALAHRNTASVVPLVGHVSFISSGELYENNNQGLNDQVRIDLHNIPDPGPGKSYYAWLLGDENQTEVPWVLLGQLSVNQGDVQFLYLGDRAHTNLLSDMSRFLITEGVANTTPTNPSLDQSSWRYFAGIYQAPSPKDPNHFSLLDHLRHLLVQAPELQVLGLPGGLSIWLMRNVQEISKWALSAKERWEIKDIAFMRQQLVNILYYLDGECTQADLQGVPPGTPATPENGTIAHIAHFALFNPCIQEEQEQATLLKNVFQHVPHNYVDHMLFHLARVIQSPGATPALHALAIQINTAVNNVKNWLGQVRLDAVQLLHIPGEQLTQLSAFEILGNLELQARSAFAGQTDPDTGNLQEGAAWIFDNIERLATLDVTAYSPR
jgi:serine/threonine protein kinase